MTVTTDHFHEQLGRTIHEELDYLLKDIDHYEVPIRIEDALRAAKVELYANENLLNFSGMKQHLKEFQKLTEKVSKYEKALHQISEMGEGYDAAMIKVADEALET